MSRLLRLFIVSVFASIVGSGVAGDAIPEAARRPLLLDGVGPVPVAEAASWDWQTVFPNGDFEEEGYEPNPPPTNSAFTTGLNSWTVDSAPVFLETDGPTGNYAEIEYGGIITSPEFTLEYEDNGLQTISLDIGFLETESPWLDEVCLEIYGLDSEEDETLLHTECESEEFLPS